VTRWLFPQDRLVFRYGAPGTPLYSPQGETVTIFTNSSATVAASIQDSDGNPIDNTLDIGSDCLIPEFLGPDGLTEVYAKDSEGAVTALYAQTGQIVESLAGTYIPVTAEGVANGVATLGSDGKVPTAQLPSASSGAVTSVNTHTGAVVLGASDVGAYSSSAGAALASRVTATESGRLLTANNLSDLASTTSARTNLGLGGAALRNVGTTSGTVADGGDSRITGALQASDNLSDLTNAATARTSLGLGNAALLNVGTASGQVAAGNDPRITGALQASSNLSDVADVPTARTSLGLGNAATRNVGTLSGTAAAGDDARITGAAQKSANLSDLASASTARTNLGLTAPATAAFGTTAGTVMAGDDNRIAGAAQKGANLSDLASTATARTNLGLTAPATASFGTTSGTVMQGNDARVSGALQNVANLSDVSDASAARTNLGLGGSSTLDVGTATGTVMAGDDSRVTGAAQKSANLSDLANAGTSRTNLGLGSAATRGVGTTSADVAAGDAPANAVTAHAGATDPHGDRAYADGKFRVRTVRTIAQHIADNPFYVGHRGSSNEFPEHSMLGYEMAVAAGAKAIEVSVQISADGVLFCMHDTTLDRITNGTWTGSNATWTYAALNQVAQVQMQGLLGSGWANQPIPRLTDVLDRFIGRVVIFLEGKSSASIVPLQNLVTSPQYAGCQDSVVWKNYYTNSSFAWAHSHGFYCWGYLDTTTTGSQMDAVDANIDMWGIPAESSDAQVSMVVARGKPTMVWEIHRRSEAAHFVSLGVKGLMCARFVYVTHSTPIRTVDDFATKINAPGQVGSAKDDQTAALKFDTQNSVYNPTLSGNSVLMGSFCPVTVGTNGYKITWDMQFPVLPSGTLHAGITLSCADDSKHTWNATSNTVGSYQVRIVPTTGAMRLYKVTAGVATALQIGSDLTTTAMTAGAYASFECEVNPTGIVMRRTDSTGWTSPTIVDTTNRGQYFHIQNGSLTDPTTIPRFKNMQVVSL
jgi:glycerophosphoryl diester phosphodiesterase